MKELGARENKDGIDWAPGSQFSASFCKTRDSRKLPASQRLTERTEDQHSTMKSLRQIVYSIEVLRVERAVALAFPEQQAAYLLTPDSILPKHCNINFKFALSRNVSLKTKYRSSSHHERLAANKEIQRQKSRISPVRVSRNTERTDSLVTPVGCADIANCRE